MATRPLCRHHPRQLQTCCALCDRLIDYAKDSPLLPQRSSWEDDATELGEIGVTGCVDVLDRLGIDIDLKALSGSLSIATWSPD